MSKNEQNKMLNNRVGNSIMNVNLQQFTRTWPSATAGMAEGKEGGDEKAEEEDELGEKINYNYYYDYYYTNTKTIY